MTEGSYEGIAIIGVAGRFPGADSVEEFWANLVAGKESISIFTDEDLRDSGMDPAELKRRGQYVPARGVLNHADCFDAGFFGVHPKEAEVMDPQQRVFLEACWTALERAGYAPNKIQSTVGVFGGITFNTYFQQVLQQHPELIELVGSDSVMFGNEKDYLTTRVAYKLGLQGPAVNVSTACSTSMVAVCQACQSLLTYQCDLALAGGASVTVPQKRGYYFDEGNIGSADGHTRTFDAQASGTVFSNGVGVVVLKRLEDAMEDGDSILAVIKAAALNNDGSQRVSFGAPGVEGQSQVIAMAHALADVDPATINYVEAHGTATPLGDPIEIAGLTKAFRLGTERRQFCALGSVKTNIGHLDAAAGVTGLIKTALALHEKVIPATLHFTRPNPKLDLENSPFYVNSELQSWQKQNGTPRRAGVSSFGTGGTNAHVILEEAPELQPSSVPSRQPQLLILSAKTEDALEVLSDNLGDHLTRLSESPDSENAGRELADVAFTLQVGRSEFSHRRVVVCENAAHGADALKIRDSKRVFSDHQQLTDRPVVFLFPGQGAQFAGMGADLYRTEPVFRAEVDRCATILRPHLNADMRALMFDISGDENHSALSETRLTQPSLFTIEYALAKLWMSWGIRPVGMAGHSIGEYVAGCLAGVFQLEDALSLVAARAALVQAQPRGGMLGIRLPEKEVLPFLDRGLAVAAVNSPNLCVVSGPSEAIADLSAKLKSMGIAARALQTSHAFHSPMMEPVIAPFTELLERVELRAPEIPYVSNVTATWVSAAEAQSPRHWAHHLRGTVRFADSLSELLKDSKRVLLEVGPGQTLSTLARQHPSRLAAQPVLTSLPSRERNESLGILETLGRLWVSGVQVDWRALHADERRSKVVLPSYPFERKRYWPEPLPKACPALAPAALSLPGTIAAAPILPERTELSETKLSETAAVLKQTSGEVAIPRKERLVDGVRSLLHELSGYDLTEVDARTDLLELGLDSLLLTQAAQLFQRKFGVPVSFRQLMEELNSIESIAAHLDASLPPDVVPASMPVPVEGSSEVRMSGVDGSGTLLQRLLAQQQQLTSEMMRILGGQPVGLVTATSTSSHAATRAKPEPVKAEFKAHGPFKPFTRDSTAVALSPVQNAALAELIARYTRRTAESKKAAAANRTILADARSAAGFKQLWKEMVYPIATTRSDGSKVWDVDGNEYVDFVMGFGASLFGHRPEFVVRAVQEQLERGFEIGPIQPLAGEVAVLLKEFTGMQRYAFTNTGSEAVLAATRVARTVTGRDKIAVFAGAYHGIFDEVLFRPLTINGETRTAPISPGVPQTALGQVIVLDYGNPQSLEIIKRHGSEIAAVLVEPVQSRRLDLQPREFMHELRRVTKETGSALIFDEVVTGFRLHPGGAQAYFEVRADLATYGKVFGGGLPIGAVAGDSKYMDALDGGQWQYGDASFPEVGVTFFAGTFVRHPLALAAAKAVLVHLKEQGPELQVRLAERTAELADQLRTIVHDFEAPYHITQFTSMIQLGFPAEQKFAGLLFYLLRERGIHIWENRAFVMTSAHTEQDISKLLEAFRESLSVMRSANFIGSDHVSSDAFPSKSSAAVKIPAEQNLPIQKQQANRTGTVPLTEAQKEIWLAAQMGGDAALGYNESLKLEFHGSFDKEAFQSALQEIMRRHPILLANISDEGQSQTVNAQTALDAPFTDLSGSGENERKSLLDTMIDSEVSTPFDLAAGPLLRIQIVRLSDKHHVVIWTAHHIVCDGWSGGLVVSELAEIYSAKKKGVQPVLEEPSSFLDYAIETREEPSKISEDMEYWRRQFATLPPTLELPADYPRPRVRTARAARIKKSFEPSLQRSVKKLAGQQRTTQVVLLMGVLKTLLYRLAGQTDIVIGLGIAGQAVKGTNCLVGHCVNLLPVRTELHPDLSFEQNLAQVKRGVLDAFDHNRATLGSILQHLSVPRSTSRPPLVEVIFNVDRDPGASEFEGLQFVCEQNPKRALHFDLFFNFIDGPNGLSVECDFNTDLFEAVTIERWLQHYRTLLESVVTSPSQPLDRLPILTESEVKELISGFNQTQVDYPEKATLHTWFESQVNETPEATALAFQGAVLSYAALNARANQLAHYLRRCGVGPDILVGLFVERSFEMVVGILGILKAGGAYVPLDPDYPVERLAFMLNDTGAPIILTQNRLAERLPANNSKVVCLDADLEQIAESPAADLPNITTPNNLAYVIYTSGSTGMPKGAMNTHRGICNRLLWMQDRYRLDGGRDTVLQKTPYSFDVSVWEFFWPLLVGSRLVLADPGGHRDPAYLTDLIVKERVTVSHFVPSMLAAFVNEPAVSHCQSLRHVISSGEALSVNLQEQFFKCLPASLHNLYGPTEAAVDVTHWTCHRDGNRNGVPIGIPVANTQIYILDRHLRPVPIRVTGELYIGGVQVGAGYLNRPELTKERFIPDPFSGNSEGRLYKTGDLARFRPDGVIEYIGRVDFQVKIRGFRIELGEVEAALDRHPAVRRSLVLARGDEFSAHRLVAYVVPRPGEKPEPEDLRAELKKTLPEYMIPELLVILEAFPLTANGKIDRQALPAPDQYRQTTANGFLAPSDSLEQVLVRLWSKILRVRQVSLNDNFFELGGHSLLAVRLIVEIEKLYRKRLPLATLIQFPTVAGLAEIIRKEQWQPSWSSLVPIRPGGSKPPLFLMHSHGGNVLEYYPLADLFPSSQPVYAIQARGLDGNIIKDRSIEEMVTAYLQEVRSLQPEGPYYLGGFCFGGVLAFEAAQQLTAAGEEVALLAMIQTTHPAANAFRPDSNPLQRWWQSTRQRIDLERENLSFRGAAYIPERGQHVWKIARARKAIARDVRSGNGTDRLSDQSMPYILESLGIEHERAYNDYVPRPYKGDVILFRASKQLPGLKEDMSLGWKDLIEGSLETCELPGHQQNILIEPHVRDVAAELAARLEAAQERHDKKYNVEPVGRSHS